MTEPTTRPEPEPLLIRRAPGPGRNPKLTEQVAHAIVTTLRAGNYLKVAAQAAGVGESTLRGWLARGRAGVEAEEQHPDGHLYCPGCDLDRTDAAAYLAHQLNMPLAGDQPAPTLGECPGCGTDAPPAPWQLPEAEERYVAFLEVVTQAETAAEVAAVTSWRLAFRDDWRAARDYLVRRRPDRWAATVRVNMTTEEAERRVEQAALQVLTDLGVDVAEPEEVDLDGLGGLDDPESD